MTTRVIGLCGRTRFCRASEFVPNRFCFVAKTLDEIRIKVPPGTWRIGREPNDNPVIYETWLAETSTPSSQ